MADQLTTNNPTQAQPFDWLTTAAFYARRGADLAELDFAVYDCGNELQEARHQLRIAQANAAQPGADRVYGLSVYGRAEYISQLEHAYAQLSALLADATAAALDHAATLS